MINLSRQFQDTALDLRLITNQSVLLHHSDHIAWHLGPVDNRRENHAGRIIVSNSDLAHAVAVFHGVHIFFFFFNEPVGRQLI